MDKNYLYGNKLIIRGGDKMALKAEDVFTPGAFPEYTYISRKSAVSDLSYEFHLMQALKVSGFLTSLVGSYKMGKTILCEKVWRSKYLFLSI